MAQADRTLKRTGPSGIVRDYRHSLQIEARPEIVETAIASIQIEPTKRCNQKCPMCTQPELGSEHKGDMSFEQYQSIFDQLPNCTEVKLQGLGEILLNRDIWRMLEFSVCNDARVLFATNALLVNEATAKRLIELGNIDVRFSLDTLVEERYARIRGVDTFKRCSENIRRFAELRRRHGRKTVRGKWVPSAEIRMVCMDENVDELPEIIAWAGHVGIERVTATLCVSKRHNQAQAEYVSQIAGDLSRQALGTIEARSREEARRLGVGLKVIPYVTDILHTCEWPWRMPYITYDGHLTPCCHIENPQAGSLGNVFEESFERIWNGPRYREFRRSFTDLRKNRICWVCPYLRPDQLPVGE